MSKTDRGNKFTLEEKHLIQITQDCRGIVFALAKSLARILSPISYIGVKLTKDHFQKKYVIAVINNFFNVHMACGYCEKLEIVLIYLHLIETVSVFVQCI